MKLIRLTENCPTCGERLVNVHWGFPHTNGYTPESTEYDCGCKMSYTPNYEGSKHAIETTSPCNRDKTVLIYSALMEVEMSIIAWPVPDPNFLFENMDLRAEANEALTDSRIRKLLVLRHNPRVKQLIKVDSTGYFR